MNRKSFIRSIIGAVAFSPAISKLVEKMDFKIEGEPKFTTCDSVTQSFIEETSRMLGQYCRDMYENKVTSFVRFPS